MNNFDLDRFVRAQSPVYAAALRELSQGAKRTHWMWFVLPQLAGLGTSEMARRYAISSADEARAYLAHPILGPRLRECTEAVNALENTTADAIFGYPDNRKFQSCLTLFEATAPDSAIFSGAIEKYFAGKRDPETLRLLAETSL